MCKFVGRCNSEGCDAECDKLCFKFLLAIVADEFVKFVRLIVELLFGL
jgi:hypothetical protein